MALSSSRRSVMTLYSGETCPYSHRTRLVLAEKSIPAEVVNVADNHLPEDILPFNPYGSVPTLVDRELVIYESRIIMEYLDERYPHPPLMPVDPISRAQCRLYLYRIERDWYGLLPDLMGTDQVKADEARRVLRDELIAVSPIFGEKPFFMSDEFTMVDCSLAPLLWRLPLYGIELLPQAQPLSAYANRIFKRAGFRASLTAAERAIRS